MTNYIHLQSENGTDILYANRILSMISGIKMIGESAITIKNSDVVYRALEDLGYLGCTAVKKNELTAVTKCLQSIVQLGRESNANKLKCFWTHCALETVDHAEQRIYWMMTWISKTPAKDHEQYLRSFMTAYSRLSGKKTILSHNLEEGKSIFTIKKTEEDHIESISDGRYYRTVDYSNPNEVKELKLY